MPKLKFKTSVKDLEKRITHDENELLKIGKSASQAAAIVLKECSTVMQQQGDLFRAIMEQNKLIKQFNLRLKRLEKKVNEPTAVSKRRKK